MKQKINISEIIQDLVNALQNKVSFKEIVEILFNYGYIDEELNLTDEVISSFTK